MCQICVRRPESSATSQFTGVATVSRPPVPVGGRLPGSFFTRGMQRGGSMLKLQRSKGSAKWAGRVLVAGVLAVGPGVLLSSAASSTAAKCSNQGRLLSATGTPLCTVTGQATVTAGSLAVAAPSTVKWAATLSGGDLNQDGRLTITAVDATGSGTGWNLTATVTPFTDSTGTSKCTLKHPCR